MNSEEMQEYLDYKKEKNYKAILSKIHNEEKTSKSKFLKIVATLLITIIGTTGIVLASFKIYNEYIKMSGTAEMDSPTMYFDSGELDLEEDLIKTEEDKEYYEKNRIEMSSIEAGGNTYYYKTISNIEDYNKYKEKLSQLPEMSSEDFNNNFFVLVGINGRTYSIRGLTISDVSADKSTTYIKIKQKENPEYEDDDEIIYSIVDKSLLRENAKLDVEIPHLAGEGMKRLEDLPSDYSKEDAIADGCFVIDENRKIVYNNINALDNIIKNSEKGIESHIRIYHTSTIEKNQNAEAKYPCYIIDLQYKNNFFTATTRILSDNKTWTETAKYLIRVYETNNKEYYYGLSDNEQMIEALGKFIKDRGWDASMIIRGIPASQFE